MGNQCGTLQARHCIDRNALAKACCCGDKEAMASLNSWLFDYFSRCTVKQRPRESKAKQVALGVGIIDSSSGMVSSSLF